MQKKSNICLLIAGSEVSHLKGGSRAMCGKRLLSDSVAPGSGQEERKEGVFPTGRGQKESARGRKNTHNRDT